METFTLLHKVSSKVPPHGTCLDCTLLGVQVTTGMGFFSVFRSFNTVKIVTPCSISFGFLAGPGWDSEMEEKVKSCIIICQ